MKAFRLARRKDPSDAEKVRKFRPSGWTILFALPAFIAFRLIADSAVKWKWGPTQSVCVIVLVLSIVGVFAFMARTARKVAKTILNHESVIGGQFILYLRSFADDESFRLPFQIPLWMRAGQPSIELEELFVHLLQVHGAVVAVGRPKEKLSPLGAARVYFEHKDWKSEVLALMKRSRFIVMLLGNTTGFHWEFAEVVRSAWLARTLVIVPPLPPDEANRRWELLAEAVSPFPVALPSRLPRGTVAVAFSTVGAPRFVSTEGSDLMNGKDYIASTEAALKHLAHIIGRRGAGEYNDDLESITLFPIEKRLERQRKRQGFTPPSGSFTPPSGSFEPPQGWSGD